MSEVILHLINKYQLGGSLLVYSNRHHHLENLRDFENAVNKYSEGKCSLVKAVTPASKSIFKCGVINGYLKNITGDNSVFFKNRRDFPDLFSPTGAYYLFRGDDFLGQGGFPSDQILPVVTYAPYNIDIDKPEDLSCAESCG